ncbi:MAG: CDP-2,3-bis-(O-geranylgeranyl)-sn-glycerol synthase [Candidatus Korarchaeum sp.]|nr:CDP-2,3-bis-(O-geranylgeranyl)-sn-glycerol synthase [Candidatus Korarchaeum sp.]MDW8036239.1 CDP-2,3-bis-(O-geranylgeranyl)-sn-glycerol synthase [Candidatus Korarchaeum sp.]
MELNPYLQAIWYVLPSYFANMSPVVFGGGRPLDMGRNFIDGRRILGDHKTVRGFLSGILVGSIVGVLQGRLLQGFVLSLGAMVGDCLGSFLKRRMGLAEGSSAPILDQEGFLIFSLLFASPLESLPLESILFLVILTPLLHWGSNTIAHLLGLKEVGH